MRAKMRESPERENPRRTTARTREAPLLLQSAMAFIVLAAIVAGEIALIRGFHHVAPVPLPQAAQLVLHLTFGR